VPFLQRLAWMRHSLLRVTVAFGLAVAMWAYVDLILVANQQVDAVQRGVPRGNLSDLYPRWVGARDLLLAGRDPYSQQVTREAQKGYYGRVLDSRNPHDPADQQAFAYPVYVVFLLAPTIRADFDDVQIAFRWILLGLTILSVPLWLKVLQWRVSRASVLTIVLLTLGSFPAAQGIKLQQLSLLVGAFIAAGLAAVVSGWLVLAGIVFAVATIKPQITLPLLTWMAVWTSGDLRRRWRLALSFSISMAVLLIASEIVLPGWKREFWVAVQAYRQYTHGISVLAQLLGESAGVVATALLLTVLMWICWRGRKVEPVAPEFGLIGALVLAVTIIVIPTWAPYNQVLLVPAILLLVRDWRGVMRAGSAARLIYLLTVFLVAWPWVAATWLDISLLFRPAAAVQAQWTLPLYTSLPIPVGVAATLLSHSWYMQRKA